MEIDVAALRQSCRGLRWVPTDQQKADALTKCSASLRDSFRKWAMEPIVALVDSKSPEETFGDNAQWKSHMLTKEKVYQCESNKICHGERS